MAISRESVVWGFRLVLGREPDSEEGIQAHLALPDEATLMETLLRSPEFANSGRFAKAIQVREGVHAQARSRWVHQATTQKRFVIFGNCQAAGIARLIQAMTGDATVQVFETTPSFLARLGAGDVDLASCVEQADIVLVQMVGEVTRWIRSRLPACEPKVRVIPPISFAGFHPDCVYVATQEGRHLHGPMGEYQSSIAFWSWKHGLSVPEAIALFRDEVYQALGFHDHYQVAYRQLVQMGRRTGYPLGALLDRWRARGCFMHTINHPHLAALADLTELILAKEGVQPLPGVAGWVEDRLANWPVWPVYPEIAARLGVPGSCQFKLDRGFNPPDKPVLTQSLADFVKASYEVFREARANKPQCARVGSEPYRRLEDFAVRRPRGLSRRLAGMLNGRKRPEETVTPSAAPPATNPYEALPDHHYWRRAVAQLPFKAVDPVVRPVTRLARTDRIATAGSCFAQHISRSLQAEGFNYLVVDADPKMPRAEARARGFGVFSARFGNLYTARQLVQLFDRAYGDFKPLDQAWQRADGKFVDPFRPQVEPEGFASERAVLQATREHLADVRRMFSRLDVFVFTLGLTEAWQRREDGAVFPLAPGVAGGAYDPALHEFVNFTAAQVKADLLGFLQRLRSVNPGARVILTVSPVPLIATYENDHVLVSTVRSKSVLRAAAGEVATAQQGVDYFPSYEMVTGPQAKGRCFEADLRSVAPEAVAHVMQTFLRHYASPPGDGETAPPAAAPRKLAAHQLREGQALAKLVCDEEALDRHRSDP